MSLEVDKICRTCLGLTGPLLSIYDGDSKNCVAEMLRDFTKMKPKPTDNMPSKVCLTCISEINRCFSFKMKCENANRTLRQLFQDAVPEEESASSSKPVEFLNKSSQTILPLRIKQKSVQVQTILQETSTRSNLKAENFFPINKRKTKINTACEKKTTFSPNKANGNSFTNVESSDSECNLGQSDATETILPDSAVNARSPAMDDFDSYAIECVEDGNEYVVELKQVAEVNESMPAEMDMLVTPSKNHAPKNGAAVYEITQASDFADALGTETQQSEISVQITRQKRKSRTEFEAESFENVSDEDVALEDENYVDNQTLQNDDQKVVSVLYDAKHQRKEYKCSECTQTFISLNVLRRHMIKFHDLYASQEITEKTEQLNKAETSTNLPVVLSCPKRLHFCRQCQARFTTKRSMDMHMKKNVCNMLCYKCSTCERVFETAEQLGSHVAIGHVEKAVECVDCNLFFTSQEELSKHQVSVHKRSLLNQCNICKKVFTMMSTLKDHLRIHTGEKPFKCTVCDKAFSQKSNLKQHMQRHEKTKIFQCSQCEDRFVTRSELFSHQRKHTGAQPFKCDFCSAAFSTNSTLNKHRRQHTGEKPYACDLCPMRFIALNVLKNHRRTHTGEKPFSCPVCKKKFRQQGDFTIHLKSHDSANNHYCLCGKKYPIPSRLIKHQKSCKFIKKEIDIEEDVQKSSDEMLEISIAKICDV